MYQATKNKFIPFSMFKYIALNDNNNNRNNNNKLANIKNKGFTIFM